MSKKSNKIGLGKMVIRTFLNMWEVTPICLILFLLSAILYGLLQVIQIYAMQRLFDTVKQFSSDLASETVIYKLIWLVSGLSLTILITDTVQFLSQGHLYRRAGCQLQSLLHRKSSKLPLLDFELSESFDKIKLALDGSTEASSVGRGVLKIFTYYIPFFVMTGIYLFFNQPVLAIIVIVSFAPVYVSQVVKAKLMFRLQQKLANVKRKYSYYENCIMSRENVKETRIQNANEFFNKKIIEHAEEFNQEVLDTEKQIFKYDTLLNSLKMIGFSIILVLLVYYIVVGNITIGLFASVFYSLQKFDDLSKQFTTELGSIMQQLSFSSFFFEFIEKDEQGGNNNYLDKNGDILLSNVSFSYPGTSKDVIKNLNLSIKNGESVAIVGVNGAGKTTLSKLLMGLYLPSKGSVSINGRDTSKYSPKMRYDNISGVFQKFQRYMMSLYDNIHISEVSRTEPIENLLSAAGLSVKSEIFPDGENTILSREFGGVDLSGGLWQRVAIARGLYRKHKILILDEPTSAVDPIEESALYYKFKELVNNKTAIIITHRLGLAKIADRIVVMNDGEIVEEGSHEDLLSGDGLYAEMFNEQSKWYLK